MNVPVQYVPLTVKNVNFDKLQDFVWSFKGLSTVTP